MLSYVADYKYLEVDGAVLFTMVLLPDALSKHPVVIYRSPYVDATENEAEDNILTMCLNDNKDWLKRGYAVVYQHCRGRGKSSGDCIPYINEREDGLALQEWIRSQSFYNGELFLCGSSYLSSVHYATAPFAKDIKGAVFGVQDTERYNICYRNGFFKKALHGSWYITMYKAKSHIKKNYTPGTFDMLPLKDFTSTVFGENAEDFDELLKAPNPADPFWNTRFGGNDARDATMDAGIPMLLTTGFYDIYTGGIFDMWNAMTPATRNMSCLVVSPYEHSDAGSVAVPVIFPKGRRKEQFGKLYEIDWLDYIRGKRDTSPFKTGAVTYYSSFKNTWETTQSFTPQGQMDICLGEGEKSYVYNPFDPPSFNGGLSRCFGGTAYQAKAGSRHDVVTLYTRPFCEDTEVRGKMSASLTVKSDCEDTCFYVRISLEKQKGDYGLRDDITSLCYQLGDYAPNTYVKLDFQFDDHAFLIKKGERLRVDIASADNDHYVRHTNQKGLYSLQTTARIAHNTICLEKSHITLPVG